ncbi:uncharacterized protein K02A2.6-like [Ornithodoros turicata]|uniref:uncharacterized protein K02A2.6-like n=1 Tax=Ornithodoros turicata TaxID=34597 RepID=UPI00313860E7
MAVVPAALPAFPPFDLSSDHTTIGDRWQRWINRFENLLVGLNITSPAQKKALLLHYIGDDGYDVYTSLEPHPGTAVTQSSEAETRPDAASTADVYATAKKKLHDHFTPKVNKDYEIFQFRRTTQQEDENIDSFYTRLRTMARNCSFANTEAEIKSQIVLGTTSTKLRRFALQTDATLDQLLTQGRTYEITARQVKDIEASMSTDVHRLTRKKSQRSNASTDTGTSTSTRQDKQCFNCGGAWPHKGGKQSCPARNATCNACRKRGHFAVVCRSKNNTSEDPNVVHQVTNQSADSESGDEAFALFPKSSKAPRVMLTVFNKELEFIIDTGATVNIISLDTYNSIPQRPQLVKPVPKVFAYGSKNELPLVGKFRAPFSYKTSVVEDTVLVTATPSESLLCFRLAEALGLISIAYNVATSKENILSKYPKLFTGLGELRGFEVQLHIDPTVPPVAQKARPLPFHIREAVEKEIDRLIQLDVIEKATGPTTWVSPIVVVPKPHAPDQVRQCVDMRRANQAIIRERHTSPTLEDLVTCLNGAMMFSKLDLNDGYHQLLLKEDCRHITTFATHMGLYRYKRLNFGINAAAELFQNTVRQVLAGIPGVINISDDILVYGKTEREHNDSLDATLKRLADCGITLSPKKCCFFQRELTFFGHIFSEKGIKPDPAKVQGFLNMPPPRDVSEVRSLLGMITYCGRFIPNLAQLTAPLRSLTKKETPWNWTTEHQKALDQLKDVLTHSSNLAYFDQNKTTHLTVDAGPKGLGAILAQDGGDRTHVVAYASRSLTEAEERYSQIEKETLAAVWAIEHFNIYLYGTSFVLHTDHKPLVNILTNPSSRPSARIERLCLRIQQYSFTVQHQKGSENPSDYMSRHPVGQTNPRFRASKVPDEYVLFLSRIAVPRAINTEEVIKATLADVTCQELTQAIQACPSIRHDLWNKPHVKPYKPLETELSVTPQGLILRGTRLLLPSSLQERAVQLAHKGHMGMVKTKQLLRESVWFPKMDTLLEKAVRNCIPCQAVTHGPKRDPLKPTPLPDGPWENLAMDFAGPFPNGKYLLVLVDEYSRFPVVEVVPSTTASSTIAVLRRTLSQFGIPKQIKTDNGPPFNSSEFKLFAQELGFRHHRVTPLWPEANGEAERFIQTLMKAIKTCHVEEQNWMQKIHDFLLCYRATAHTTTKLSPYELLFGRKMLTTLPSSVHRETTDTRDATLSNDTRAKEISKARADEKRHTGEHTLQKGDVVLVKQKKISKLTSTFDPVPYIVVEVIGSQISAKRNNHIITRNASFFKKLGAEYKHTPNVENSDEDDELLDDTRRDDPQNQTSNDPPDDDRHHDGVSAQDSGSPNRYPIRSSRGVPPERLNYT